MRGDATRSRTAPLEGASIRLAVALGVVASLCGCSEVVTLQATTGLIDGSCGPLGENGPYSLRSIRVQAIAWYGGEPGDVLSSACFDTAEPLPVGHPRDILDWFGLEGVPLIDGLPTDVPQRVQIIGWRTERCQMSVTPWAPLICGISQDTLSETGFSEGDEARFTFSCARDPASPSEPRGLYGLCLGFGSEILPPDR